MTKPSICSLDDLRREHPTLGAAIYAYQPGEDVTLEVHTPDGQMFSWSGSTEADVLSQAFPPDLETNTPAIEEPTPTNIFD
jgi:hypothetical protein